MFDEPRAWDRLPGEPARAYAAFTLWLSLGPERTLSAAAEAARKASAEGRGRPPRAKTLGNWARRWRWEERAAAWDAEQARRRLAIAAREIDEMHQRHLQFAAALQGRLARRISELDPSALSPADVVRWLEAAVRIEREARGLSSATVSVRHEEAGEQAALVRRLLADPVASEMALGALERVAMVGLPGATTGEDEEAGADGD
jgi:hypothetical protein